MIFVNSLLTLRAEESIPALLTYALKAVVAVAVLAARQGNAFVTQLSVETCLKKNLNDYFSCICT